MSKRAFPTVETAQGRNVAVASGHSLASAEAVRVFLDGGNIIDAAIAGAAVLAVVLPYAAGIGGDTYVLYYDAKTGRTAGLNGTGSAPAAATRHVFPDGMPEEGIFAASVPGTIAAWEDALSRFGTRSLAAVLETAIGYARDGFAAHEGLIENQIEKRVLLAKNPEATRVYLPNGQPHRADEMVVQSDLATVLSRIARDGAREFYEGETAQDIARGMSELGGLITRGDLAQHRTIWQNAIQVRFRGHDVMTMPPNSLGLSLLLQLMALEANAIAEVDPDGIEFWEKTIAAWRWAAVAAKEHIGDPAETVARARELLERLAKDPIRLPLRSTVEAPKSGDTSNLSIMDSAGNAVSLIQSVSAPFASGIVLPRTGILLNNRMRGFNTKEGSVNCVGPGRRPAHTLVPALVARDGRVTMAIGTPGAAGQSITLAQVLSRLLAFGQRADEAIAAPRWSVAPSGQLIAERIAPPAVIDGLRVLVPDLQLADVRNVRFGSVKAAWLDGAGVSAAADYRRVAGASAG
jgi:gamma-glutamyltranspeptidase/glutathione hydrolase